MSADLNNVTIIGRLTRDAEMKYSSGGMAISRFSIAVNRRKKDGDGWTDEASFFDVTLFNKSAESLSQYLVKGKQIAIKGELHQDRWTQDDGQARSKVGIIAETVQLLGGGEGARGGERGGEARRETSPAATHGTGRSDSGDDFNDDVPFN